MEGFAYPTLKDFVCLSKCRVEDDCVWIGFLTLSNTTYKATYTENKDMLKLKRSDKTYLFKPVVKDSESRYIFIIDNHYTLQLTIDKQNKIIATKNIGKTNEFYTE